MKLYDLYVCFSYYNLNQKSKCGSLSNKLSNIPVSQRVRFHYSYCYVFSKFPEAANSYIISYIIGFHEVTLCLSI